MNDNGVFTDRDTYLEALVEGDGMGDPMCMYYMVLERMFEYDEIDPEDTETCDNYRELIIQALEICAEQCLPVSFSLLGDIFHEGRIGIPADPVKAWEYYVKGSEFMHESCFEKMYDMLHDGEIEPGRMNREDAMDLCAVNGARLHNRKLLVAAVEAYRRGRLTQFAREMEMYHIPAYDTWA
jgi:TPR repeat protein